MEEAIIGVVGTLLGTILGWVLNSVSNRGKLNIYVSEWNDSFQYNKLGVFTSASSNEEATLYAYDTGIDVHNSKGEPLIMRDIRIAFNDGKSDIITIIPKDKETERSNGPLRISEEIGALTVPAKSVLHLKLHGGKQKEENKELFIWRTKKVFLLYKDSKNKQQRILLREKDYSKCFENHPQEEKHNG